MTNLTDPIFHDEDKAREHLEAIAGPMARTALIAAKLTFTVTWPNLISAITAVRPLAFRTRTVTIMRSRALLAAA